MPQQACRGERQNFNDEIDERARNEYQRGQTVQVFSHTAQGWVQGQVVEPVREGCHTVEFGIPGSGYALFRKHLLPTSHLLRSHECSTELAEYDPGAIYVIQREARSALDDFVISFGSPDLCVEEMPRITQVLHLEFRGSNAFKASSKTEDALSGPFTIAYKPGRNVEHTVVDVVLKVHALPGNEPDEHGRYKPVGPLGFVHTMLHKEGEKVRFHPDILGCFYLGFTVNKDLSVDLRNRMRASKKDRDYFEGLFERFKETWGKRGDAPGEVLAENADYLISYTGRDKDENDRLLQQLTTKPVRGPHNKGCFDQRPIKFCTDRSLGFGVHFYQRGGCVDDDELFTLKLGKHGFAQPLEDGTWWDEYRKAAMKTKCGVLVLNPSFRYFRSGACLLEWNDIPKTRRWLYSFKENRITIDPTNGNLNMQVARFYDAMERGDSDAITAHIPMLTTLVEKGSDEAMRVLLTLSDEGNIHAIGALATLAKKEGSTEIDWLWSVVAEGRLGSVNMALATLAEKGHARAERTLTTLTETGFIVTLAKFANKGNTDAGRLLVEILNVLRSLAANEHDRALVALAEKGRIAATMALTALVEKGNTEAVGALDTLVEELFTLAEEGNHYANQAINRLSIHCIEGDIEAETVAQGMRHAVKRRRRDVG